MWKRKLAEKCKDLKIETVVENGGLSVTLRCSEIPDKHIQTGIESIIPDNIECNFIVAPKTATIEGIKNIILYNYSNYPHKIKGSYNINNRKLIIHLTYITQSELTDIKEIVDSDNYFSSYEIYVNGIGINLLANEIEYNNTIREKIINSDDILNFVIHLNSSKTFEEFIEGV